MAVVLWRLLLTLSAQGLVCLCVCHISPLERLFVLKILPRTQLATEVQKYVGFSLKLLRCRVPALLC